MSEEVPQRPPEPARRRIRLTPLKVIGLAVFIAVLAIWPIAIYLSRQRVWNEATFWIVEVMLLSCNLFFAGCAVVLSSWIIGGMLIGLCVGVLLGGGFGATMGAIIGFSIAGALSDWGTAKNSNSMP